MLMSANNNIHRTCSLSFTIVLMNSSLLVLMNCSLFPSLPLGGFGGTLLARLGSGSSCGVDWGCFTLLGYSEGGCRMDSYLVRVLWWCLGGLLHADFSVFLFLLALTSILHNSTLSLPTLAARGHKIGLSARRCKIPSSPRRNTR